MLVNIYVLADDVKRLYRPLAPPPPPPPPRPPEQKLNRIFMDGDLLTAGPCTIDPCLFMGHLTLHSAVCIVEELRYIYFSLALLYILLSKKMVNLQKVHV